VFLGDSEELDRLIAVEEVGVDVCVTDSGDRHGVCDAFAER
jgi:hypothetical protein